MFELRWLLLFAISCMIPMVNADPLQSVIDGLNSLDSTLRIVVICVVVVVVLALLILVIWMVRKIFKCIFGSRTKAKDRRMDVYSVNALPVPSDELIQERQRQSQLYMSQARPQYMMQQPPPNNYGNYHQYPHNGRVVSGVPLPTAQPLTVDTQMGIVRDIGDAPTLKGTKYETRLSQLPQSSSPSAPPYYYGKQLPDINNQRMRNDRNDINNRDTIVFVDVADEENTSSGNYHANFDESPPRMVRSAGAIDTVTWDQYRNDIAKGKYKVHQDDMVSYDL